MAFFADDPVAEALYVCARVSFPEVEEGMALARCWYGVGQGTARLSAYDLDRVLEVCSGAPTDWSADDCLMGASMAGIASGYARGETFLPFSREFCEGVPGRFVYGCFRHLAFPRSAYGDAEGAMSELSSACLSVRETERARACWVAVGLLSSADPILPGQDASSVISRRSAVCYSAPYREMEFECLRALTQVLVRERGGVPLSLFEGLFVSEEEMDGVLRVLRLVEGLHAGKSTSER